MTMNTTQTFREWFKENLMEDAENIANHGADGGYTELTWTNDCADTFDRFEEEIWSMAVEDAEDFGCKNVLEMISGFGRVDMADTIKGFKNLMLWYAAEKIAREIMDEMEENKEE